MITEGLEVSDSSEKSCLGQNHEVSKPVEKD